MIADFGFWYFQIHLVVGLPSTIPFHKSGNHAGSQKGNMLYMYYKIFRQINILFEKRRQWYFRKKLFTKLLKNPKFGKDDLL
jgi:hypothetical protein